MSKNSRLMRVPADFHEMFVDLTDQISKDTGFTIKKSQTLQLFTKDFKGKILWKGKKFDIKLF